MKLGLVLDTRSSVAIEALAAQAAHAEESGFDLVWVEPAPLLDDAIVVAAALSSRTSTVRLVAAVAAGGNPVRIAEDAAVADLLCGGRFVLAIGGDRQEPLAETIDVLFRASAPAPFRHDGEQWTVPAGLPENERTEQRLRVLPDALQLELPIWLTGAAAAAVSATHGLSFVAAEGESATEAAGDWLHVEERLGPAAARLRRPALVAVGSEVDPEALIAELRGARDGFGLDVAVLRLPPGLEPAAQRKLLHVVASEVRPRLQLDRLPDGLEEHWRRELRS